MNVKIGKAKIRLAALALSAGLSLFPFAEVVAQATVCAEVRLQIAQEATLEREAFDAALEITNQFPNYGLENFRVDVVIKDAAGNSADTQFFVKVNSKDGITAVDGTGIVQPATTANVHWLIIPSTGAGGVSPLGLKYSVKADISYKLNGIYQTISTYEDYITVKPQPALKLEYMLPFEVFADEPLTENVVEPLEPFALGVRVTNVGYGTAKNFKIDSGQPEITDNKQGLAVDSKLLGTYVGNKKITDTLLVPFGDVAAGGVTQAAWIMSTTLSGRFVKFDASFTHADEIGGQLTSLVQNVTTYTLLKDVLVDLPGRDSQFDFLVNTTIPRVAMYDILTAGGEIKPDFILESDQPAPIPVERVASEFSGALGGASTAATLRLTGTASSNAWVYTSVPAPLAGKARLLSVVRSDGKAINPRNVWISKHFVKSPASVVYRLNLLDYNPSAQAEYALNFSLDSVDTPPAPIADLGAYSASGSTQAGLSWSSTGEDGTSGTIFGGHYLIQTATSAGAAFSPAAAQITFSTNTAPGVIQSYMLAGLAGNTTHYFKLWLQDTGGSVSADSNLAQLYVSPKPPSGLVPGAISSSTATVGWVGGNNNSPVAYGVWVDTDAVGPVVAASPYKDAADRSFVFTGLTPNTTYLIFGQAKNPDTDAVSAQAYLGSTVTLAAQPGALVSSGVFVSSLTLAWDANGNPAWTEYFVQLSTVPGWSPAAAVSAWQAQTSYAFTGLAQSTTYYARVKAKNSAGVETAYTDLGMFKTKVFDTLPPVTAISFTGHSFWPGQVYVSSLTSISLTASDDVLAVGDRLGSVASILYSIDSDTASGYTGSFSLVVAGAHVVRYYGVDAAGNAEAVKTSSITVDDVPPVAAVEISSRVYSFGGIDYIPGSSTITLTASDALAGVKELYYELNGSTYSVQADSKAFNLVEGVYNLAYRAADNLGNTSVLRASSITVDNTAPATAFGVQGSSVVLGGSLYLTAASSVSLTAADVLSGVREINYSLDGSTAVAASPLVLSVTAGEHALAFYSADNAGNSELQKSVTFFVDAEAPVSTATLAGIAGSNGWHVSPVVLTLASTDTMSGVENVKYSLERAGAGSGRVLLSSGVYAAPLTVNEEGVYSYSYFAADRAGNMEPETTGYFKIDMSTPEVVVFSTPAANAYAWNNSPVTAVFSGTDSVSGIAFCTPGVLLKTEGSSQTISGYCSDYAGLSSTASVVINIDTTAPVVTYERVPAASTDGWNNSDVTVNFTCTDALSGMASCPAGIVLASEGANLSTAAPARDFAGNSLETIVGGINIDRAPPVSTASLSGIYDNGYYGGAVSVTIISTDTLSGVFKTYYSLDGADLSQYQGPVSVSAEGRHTVRYYAQDIAGNTEAAKTLEFAVDYAGPSVSYSLVPPPNAAGWNNSSVDIVFAGTDTLSGVSACSSGTVTSEGFAQVVTGWCRDLAGNIRYATATVNIDLTKPVIVISSPAAGAVFSAGGGKFQVGWTVVDNLDVAPSVTVQLTQTEDKGVPRGSAPASIVVENGRLIDPSDLDDGIWRLEAAAKDMAGNSTQAVSGLFEIVHDTLAPQTSLSVGAPKFTAGGNAFVTSHTPLLFSATDDMLLAGDRGGVGVAATYVYVDSQTVEATAEIFISSESTHTISYFSVDRAGNSEAVNSAVFAVDDSSPVSTIAFSSGAASGTDGFEIPEGSSVSFTAVDMPAGAASGVSAVWYSVDSGAAALFTGAFSLAAGSHTVVYWSMDNLGNTEAYKTALVAINVSGWSVKLNFTPSTLNLNSKGEAVMAKLWFEGYPQGCFRQETLNINSINGQTLLKPIYTQSSGQRHGRADKVECGTITVKFDRDALIAVLPVNAVSNIIVSGKLDDGRDFSAGDTMRTMKPHKTSRRDGGRFEHSRRARFEAPAKALKEDADSYVLSVEGDKPESEARKAAAAKAGSLERRGYAYEFGPEGSVFDAPVTISLPYDAGEKAPEKLAVAYWDEAAGVWEILTSRRAVSEGLVKAEAPHFSQYQVVAATYMVSGVEAVNRFRASQMEDIAAAPADTTFRLGEVYVFPNPAKGGKVPVFHVEVGLADSVKLRIFTVAGQQVHERILTGIPQAIGGKYAYEYAWEGHIASGVYYYTMEAEWSGKKLKARGRFAVVR